MSNNRYSTSKVATKPINVRVAVINTLLSIQQGKSLTSLLDPLLNSLNGDDKGFAHALLLTSLRHWHATARLLDSLADNPIEEIEVRTTIQLGMTQLLYLNVADHAAIHETVEAVKHIEFSHASGLVNAVLRKIAKNPNKFRKRTNKNHSLPNWLAQQLKNDWREQYDALTQSLRQSAPMFLRMNTLQADTASYLEKLTAEQIEAELVPLNTAIKVGVTDSPLPINQSVIQLIDSVPVSHLPDFEEGIASVQDAHAQLAAPIIQKVLEHSFKSNNTDNTDNADKETTVNSKSKPKPKTLRLLDACAAPGGKLAHWLELLGQQEESQTGLFHVEQSTIESDDSLISVDNENSSDTLSPIDKIELVAIDNDANRITRIFENLERLQLPTPIVNSKLHLDIICADATQWQAEAVASNTDTSDNTGFDAILLDAPCTATGVIRRHPDITLLREEEDVQHTVQLQEQILDNLWPQLKRGGYFLYITCSLLKSENVEQMQAFLKRHNDAVAVPFVSGDNDELTNWGIEQEVGRQCLPIYKMTDYKMTGVLESTYIEDNEQQVKSQAPAGGDGFYYALLQKRSI